MKQLKPHALLDYVKQKCGYKNDSQMARGLRLQKAVISKIRNGTYGVSHSLLVRAHEVTGTPIAELRVLADFPESAVQTTEPAPNTPQPISEEIIDKLEKLPRYFEQSGRLHLGGVSTHSYVKLHEVLAVLQS